MKMYKLNCISCGYVWSSRSADVCECPMCEGDDIVVIGELMNKVNEKNFNVY